MSMIQLIQDLNIVTKIALVLAILGAFYTYYTIKKRKTIEERLYLQNFKPSSNIQDVKDTKTPIIAEQSLSHSNNIPHKNRQINELENPINNQKTDHFTGTFGKDSHNLEPITMNSQSIKKNILPELMNNSRANMHIHAQPQAYNISSINRNTGDENLMPALISDKIERTQSKSKSYDNTKVNEAKYFDIKLSHPMVLSNTIYKSPDQVNTTFPEKNHQVLSNNDGELLDQNKVLSDHEKEMIPESNSKKNKDININAIQSPDSSFKPFDGMGSKAKQIERQITEAEVEVEDKQMEEERENINSERVSRKREEGSQFLDKNIKEVQINYRRSEPNFKREPSQSNKKHEFFIESNSDDEMEDVKKTLRDHLNAKKRKASQPPLIGARKLVKMNNSFHAQTNKNYMMKDGKKNLSEEEQQEKPFKNDESNHESTNDANLIKRRTHIDLSNLTEYNNNSLNVNKYIPKQMIINQINKNFDDSAQIKTIDILTKPNVSMMNPINMISKASGTSSINGNINQEKKPELSSMPASNLKMDNVHLIEAKNTTYGPVLLSNNSIFSNMMTPKTLIVEKKHDKDNKLILDTRNQKETKLIEKAQPPLFGSAGSGLILTGANLLLPKSAVEEASIKRQGLFSNNSEDPSNESGTISKSDSKTSDKILKVITTENPINSLFPSKNEEKLQSSFAPTFGSINKPNLTENISSQEKKSGIFPGLLGNGTEKSNPNPIGLFGNFKPNMAGNVSLKTEDTKLDSKVDQINSNSKIIESQVPNKSPLFIPQGNNMASNIKGNGGNLVQSLFPNQSNSSLFGSSFANLSSFMKNGNVPSGINGLLPKTENNNEAQLKPFTQTSFLNNEKKTNILGSSTENSESKPNLFGSSTSIPNNFLFGKLGTLENKNESSELLNKGGNPSSLGLLTNNKNLENPDAKINKSLVTGSDNKLQSNNLLNNSNSSFGSFGNFGKNFQTSNPPLLLNANKSDLKQPSLLATNGLGSQPSLFGNIQKQVQLKK